jgi:riboflavin synthase
VFTGLIEALGTLRARERRGPGFVLRVDAPFEAFVLGESIAVSGVCLTVTRFERGGFEADVSLETARKTTLGALPLGARLNLERSLRLGDRLGGHLVSGHVDAVGRCVGREPAGDSERFVFELPVELRRYVAQKGSIAVDGTSLTVNAVDGARFDVMIIPHTRAETTFHALAAGDAVNLEVDPIARYVARWLDTEPRSRDESSLVATLRGAGILPSEPER